MKKVLFSVLAGIFFLFNCSDNPPSTAIIKMPDDATVKSSADVAFLITAIVTDSEDDTIRYNNFHVQFLCMNCEFLNIEETTEDLIEFNTTKVEKRTNSKGIAGVWVKVKVGNEASVSGTLENGSSDSTKLTVSAQ
jgi:hypothetical protein